ncbi:MAG: ATP-grasp fold amidoligase family protein [Christensenellales bacterium]
MERDSFLYKARRKMQVIAHKILPNEFLAKQYARIVLKKKISLNPPKTFNEKIIWYKLYHCPKNDLIVKCADKYAVREYIKEKGLDSILVPLINSWDNAKEIEWDALPDKFILKCNHGCAYNILCSDKSKLDKKETVKKLNKWLKEDFGAFNIETHYSRITPRKIICEEYLGECITDYKFFCFNGEPKFIYVSNDLVHDRQAKIGFFTLDGQPMPLKRNEYVPITDITLPDFFRDMLNDAKVLCKDFIFVRVDFFIANGRYYFAELTFTPSGGMMPFNPEKYDLEWGNMLELETEKK